MKLRLTESDIRYIVRKAKQLIREGESESSGMRGVRKIILDNILAKHPGFQGNNDVAWAYYVMYHQINREGLANEIPGELQARVSEGLRLDKEIKAKRKEELEITKAAYEEWANNPENFKDFQFNFDPKDIDESDEEAIREELKRLDEWDDDYNERNHAFHHDVTLHRDSDGGEFNRSFRVPNSVTFDVYEKRNEIHDRLYDALLLVQDEYGNSHFDKVVHHCWNNGEPEDEEFKKRWDMLRKEEAQGKRVAVRGFEVGRCYHETYYPKYKLSVSVDSSD